MRSWNKKTFTRALCLATSLVIGTFAPVYAEKVMNVIPHADLKNLDPIWTTAYISRNHGYMIYDTRTYIFFWPCIINYIHIHHT